MRFFSIFPGFVLNFQQTGYIFFSKKRTNSNRGFLFLQTSRAIIYSLSQLTRRDMKIPQFALNGSYLPTPSSGHHGNTSSHHGNGKSYLDNTSECDNSSVLSPTRSPCDEHNLMVDMAVAKDKTPFLLANKANDNLQRALNRFMVYHEREKKVKLRLLYFDDQSNLTF